MPGKYNWVKFVVKHLAIVTGWSIGGTAVTSTASEINELHSQGAVAADYAKLHAITSTASEINELHSQGAVAADFAKLHAVTALASEVNALTGAANGASGFTIGAEAVNVINVAIQLNKADGNPATMRHTVFAYLSDDPEGDDLTATAPDGGWAIGTDGVLIPVVASKAAHLVAEDDGDIDINITHAGGAKTWYLCIVHPSGKMTVSSAITFAA